MSYKAPKSVKLLHKMLQFKRPAYSETDNNFVEKFIKSLPGATMDHVGNVTVVVGDAPILWSCHTDTVHLTEGHQNLEVYGNEMEFIGLPDKSTSNCLGADDTAGIWIMIEMIKAKKPGTYIFHRGEEKGGIGSNYIAKHEKDRLKKFKFAIAFDRHGTTDIITHHFGSRCASDEFATSVQNQFENQLPDYKGCHGIYTDTYNYMSDIGECSNLSVGYYNEHSSKEYIHVEHLVKLRDAIIQLDVSKLVAKRQPGEIDPADHKYYNSGWDDYTYQYYGKYDKAYGSNNPDTQYRYEWVKDKDNIWKKKLVVPSITYKPVRGTNGVTTYKSGYDEYDYEDPKNKTLLALVEDYPNEVADLLEYMGYDEKTLYDEIKDRIMMEPELKYGGK